jgi:hypothetical protein
MEAIETLSIKGIEIRVEIGTKKWIFLEECFEKSQLVERQEVASPFFLMENALSPR